MIAPKYDDGFAYNSGALYNFFYKFFDSTYVHGVIFKTSFEYPEDELEVIGISPAYVAS